MKGIGPSSLKVMRVLLGTKAGAHLAGCDIIGLTQLSVGSVYTILRKLERVEWIAGEWESATASELGRPRRRHYSMTAHGEVVMQELVDIEDHLARFK